MGRRSRFTLIAMMTLVVTTLPRAVAAPTRAIATIDLAQAFATRSPWRFTATQGPDEEGPSGELEGGRISLCISSDNGRSCLGGINDVLVPNGRKDVFSDPHVLDRAELVQPNERTSLLLLQVASMAAMNGDQRTATLLFAYDRTNDAFSRVYSHVTGRNNSQEVRYVDKGVLRGAMISAEPTSDAPFGFWVTVHRFAAPGRYQQVLRYRSATIYGDGNRLAVIDSEMPNIQQRLSLWRPGQPLPLPDGGCVRPHLQHGALWC